MSRTSVPLSMLLTRDVPYEWHDAVALVAQLLAQVRADVPHQGGRRVPDLQGITLEENGALGLSIAPDQSMPAMPGAGQLLQQLLSGKDQPAQLRLFAMQAATADSAQSLDLFADELGKWERPNRGAKLVALHARAVQQIGAAALTEEALARDVRAVRAATERQASQSAKPKKPAPDPGKRSAGSQIALALLVFVIATAIGGGAWYVLQHRPQPAPQQEQAQSEIDTTPRPQAARPASRPAPPPDKPAAAQPPSTPAPRTQSGRPSPVTNAEAQLARARALFDRQDYLGATAAIDQVLQTLGSDGSVAAEEIRRIARSLAEVARAAVPEDTREADREYHTGEGDVSEPVPLSYLPPKPSPDTPPDKLQVLEVHVNTNGTVDSAKFVMNRPSFRNSWWTSAAKAWRFQPATKDGRPVRYVMRIVMDDSSAQH